MVFIDNFCNNVFYIVLISSSYSVVKSVENCVNKVVI